MAIQSCRCNEGHRLENRETILDYLDRPWVITWTLTRRDLSLAGIRKDAAEGKSERYEGGGNHDPFLMVGNHVESIRRYEHPGGAKTSA